MSGFFVSAILFGAFCGVVSVVVVALLASRGEPAHGGDTGPVDAGGCDGGGDGGGC